MSKKPKNKSKKFRTHKVEINDTMPLQAENELLVFSQKLRSIIQESPLSATTLHQLIVAESHAMAVRNTPYTDLIDEALSDVSLNLNKRPYKYRKQPDGTWLRCRLQTDGTYAQCVPV
jgi:hypothetical protein